MQDRNIIYKMYLNDFDSFKTAQEYKNPNFIISEASIKESIEATKTRFDFMPEVVLKNGEENYVINKIKSIYSIYQEEGDVILGDYNHNYDWYKDFLDSSDVKTYHWDRYKNYLDTHKHFPKEIIKVLEQKTLFSLMSYLGNPNEESSFSIRGLVVGDVQSGKTSNYLGLVTKAADVGYKVIFILTGTIESLRKQTQQRVEEGFIGWDSFNGVPVGVGRGDPTPKAFTSRGKDFVGADNQNTTYKLSNYSSEPMIFVLKKNVSVLKKVYSSLRTINTTAVQNKINYPALVIDDEADNASINTNKPDHDPTKINKYIRNLLSLFTRSSYVGFTATPFANVFISYDKEDEMLKDDLFPRDFIYALKSPTNYCGAKKYFVEQNNNIQFIDDADEELFPMKHKKEWDGNRLFNSLYESVRTFLLSNAIRDIRDIDKNTHRSMLINMSRFTKVQSTIRDIVQEYFDEIKRAVKQTHKLSMSLALTNPLIKELKNTYEKQFAYLEEESGSTWSKVFECLYDSISKIKIVVVNSAKNSSKLNYDETKEGLRVIAVGGLALSRGLTLEGLMTSYFYRNTSTFDVLMQMGRWFGYRDGYADLCKIWLTRTSYSYYKYIYLSTEALKNDIKTMGEEKRKPEDFGIRVMNDSIDLGITAANKMRNTTRKVIRKSFYGSLFETPYITRDLDDVGKNISNTIKFLDKINKSQRNLNVKQHPYFNNVNYDNVKDLLESLIVPSECDTFFDKKQILSFLKKNKTDLTEFDVLVIGGKPKIDGDDNPYRFKYDKLDINIPLVGRKFDVRDGNIRMSKNRLRLGGSADTSYGLDESQIPLTHSKAQDYLIEGRNPLLIIYFIRPSLPQELDEEDFVSDKDTKEDIADMMKLCRELETQKYQYIVGYALGIPQKTGASLETIMYTVNKTVNYFDKDHENESEEV